MSKDEFSDVPLDNGQNTPEPKSEKNFKGDLADALFEEESRSKESNASKQKSKNNFEGDPADALFKEESRFKEQNTPEPKSKIYKTQTLENGYSIRMKGGEIITMKGDKMIMADGNKPTRELQEGIPVIMKGGEKVTRDQGNKIIYESEKQINLNEYKPYPTNEPPVLEAEKKQESNVQPKKSKLSKAADTIKKLPDKLIAEVQEIRNKVREKVSSKSSAHSDKNDKKQTVSKKELLDKPPGLNIPSSNKGNLSR